MLGDYPNWKAWATLFYQYVCWIGWAIFSQVCDLCTQLRLTFLPVFKKHLILKNCVDVRVLFSHFPNKWVSPNLIGCEDTATGLEQRSAIYCFSLLNDNGLQWIAPKDRLMEGTFTKFISRSVAVTRISQAGDISRYSVSGPVTTWENTLSFDALRFPTQFIFRCLFLHFLFPYKTRVAEMENSPDCLTTFDNFNSFFKLFWFPVVTVISASDKSLRMLLIFEQKKNLFYLDQSAFQVFIFLPPFFKQLPRGIGVKSLPS